MAIHAPETRKVLRDLDKELAAAGAASGRDLGWTAQEQAILGQIASILDRKAEFLTSYAEATDLKVRLKISSELRLLEQAAARLIKGIKTDIPQPESLRTIKARAAVRRRWDRDTLRADPHAG